MSHPRPNLPVTGPETFSGRCGGRRSSSVSQARRRQPCRRGARGLRALRPDPSPWIDERERARWTLIRIRAMSETKRVPTLFEWMGGMPALEKLFEIGVPADPEFRSALVSYLEWGTRLAVINSQPGAAAGEDAPMPRWGWGEVKGPYTGGS